MSDTTGVFHVLLQRGAPANWQPVAAVACECAPKIAKALVTKACRFGHGLLRLMLTHDEAQTMAAKLTAAGIPAIALPLADLVAPPQPYTLMRVEFTDAALMIQTGGTTVFQPLPWDTLRMLHVACVHIRSKPVLGTLNVDAVNTGVGVGIAAAAMISGVGPMLAVAAVKNSVDNAGNAAKQEAASSGAPVETEVVLEIFTLAPLVRLRIRQSKFSYDVLGEKRQPTARANFAVLLAELQARAKHAAVTGLFPLAVNGRRIEPEKFGVDESDHEHQVSALLTIESKLGLPRG